jgi:hypothetical protein
MRRDGETLPQYLARCFDFHDYDEATARFHYRYALPSEIDRMFDDLREHPRPEPYNRFVKSVGRLWRRRGWVSPAQFYAVVRLWRWAMQGQRPNAPVELP